MGTTYERKADVIAFEIIGPIESGDVANARADFDVDAIVDEVVITITGQDGALRFTVSDDEDFWEVVERHAH